MHNKSQSGGAFLLEDAPKEEFDIQLSDGWRVTVKESEPYVVIQSESNYNKNKVFDETYDAAVRGLDIASIDQVRGLNTQMAERHHILWWTKNNNEFIQITGIATGFDRARDTVQVGNQVSEPHIPDWHESFRYYRLSLISEEPFDVYRNLFLAFESLLSDIQKKTQSHREWIEQGLEEFGHLGEQANINTHSRFRGSTFFEGLSLREIEDVLAWLGIDRCNQAIWNWRETL